MSQPDTSSRGPGRPAGTFKNPHDSLIIEQLAWLTLAKDIRELVKRQLKMFEGKISDVESKQASFNVDEQLSIMQGLRELLTTSVRTVTAGLNQDKAKGSESVEDPEQVMQQLEGGKGG